jgi:hypothetical protein
MSGALNTMNENFHFLCALCVSAVNLFLKERHEEKEKHRLFNRPGLEKAV